MSLTIFEKLLEMLNGKLFFTANIANYVSALISLSLSSGPFTLN